MVHSAFTKTALWLFFNKFEQTYLSLCLFHCEVKKVYNFSEGYTFFGKKDETLVIIIQLYPTQNIYQKLRATLIKHKNALS